MSPNSIFEYFVNLFQESPTAPVFSWNSHVYNRTDFFELIMHMVSLFKVKNIDLNDTILYYGGNHPVALSLPFVSSLLKLKYIAIPESVSLEKVTSIRMNYPIKLTISSLDNIETDFTTTTLWNNFLNQPKCKAYQTQPNCNGEFQIGFLTSGSTGSPKLILLNEEHILANIKSSIIGHHFISTDSILATLNICHSGGLCIQVLPGLCAGVPIVLHSHFNLSHFSDELLKGTISVTLIVPSFLRLIRLSSYWDKNIFSNLRLVGIGSANLDPKLALECLEKNIKLLSIYGLTEAGPFAIYGKIKNIFKETVNLGKPACGIEVKLSNGDCGRIFLRGKAVQPQIYDGELTTSLLDNNSWFDTGDEGFLHENEFYFTNRNTDIANIGGLKVNTIEVEKIINSIDGITSCAVFARKHAVFSEVLIACIEINQQNLTRKKISALCKSLLPRHMVPRNIHILNALPRSSIGKILKNDLKKLYG